MRVHFKKFHELALAPEYANPGDSGCDLRWYEDPHRVVVLQPSETRVLWTGIGIELNDGHEAQVRGRSSWSRRGLLVHIGTIDSGYRGQLGVTATNVSRESLRIERGDRIAQIVIAPVVRAEFVEADALSDSVRGEGGYGSSGVR